MQAQIIDILRQFRPLELLDVLLVAALFFGILTWLRASLPQAASRRIMLSVPAVLLVYVLVRVFDFYLLERVFQILLVVLLIGAVVVFQSDIRRMLDRLIIRYSDREVEPYEETIDVLASAAAKMAEEKTGALIAIKGREPWESHITGGVQLQGFISEPLLLGIFKPDSPGHDGAVLVDRGRVVRFAAHLPLAPDLPRISRFGGTRHAAALGLSEECDALVIAVSEEMGTISIAHEGVLTEDLSASELKEQLEEFWKHQIEAEDESPKALWQRANVRVALVSILLATLLWLVVVYSPYTVVTSFTAPVRFTNLPSDWVMEGNVPTHVNVMLAGPEQVFRRVSSEDLNVTIDLSDPQPGRNEIAITEDLMRLPAGIEIERADPPVLTLDLQRTRAVRLPVRVRRTGTLPDSLELVGLRTDPDSVVVLVAENAPDPSGAVTTSPVDFSAISEDSSIDGRLVPPSGARLRSGPNGVVVVHVDVERVGGVADEPSGGFDDES